MGDASVSGIFGQIFGLEGPFSMPHLGAPVRRRGTPNCSVVQCRFAVPARFGIFQRCVPDTVCALALFDACRCLLHLMHTPHKRLAPPGHSLYIQAYIHTWMCVCTYTCTLPRALRTCLVSPPHPHCCLRYPLEAGALGVRW